MQIILLLQGRRQLVVGVSSIDALLYPHGIGLNKVTRFKISKEFQITTDPYHVRFFSEYEHHWFVGHFIFNLHMEFDRRTKPYQRFVQSANRAKNLHASRMHFDNTWWSKRRRRIWASLNEKIASDFIYIRSIFLPNNLPNEQSIFAWSYCKFVYNLNETIKTTPAARSSSRCWYGISGSATKRPTANIKLTIWIENIVSLSIYSCSQWLFFTM